MDLCRPRNQGICLPSTLEHGTWRETDTGNQRRQQNDCRLGTWPHQDEDEDWHSGQGAKPLAGMVRQQTTGRVTHTFREHNKEADLWAGNGARGRAEEWVDTARTSWHEVLGICGFWDGSFDNGKCGGGIVLMAFSVLLTDGPPSKSVVLYQGMAPWMLEWWLRDAH